MSCVETIRCHECEITDDYPCEKWGICPNNDDFYEKLTEIMQENP